MLDKVCRYMRYYWFYIVVFSVFILRFSFSVFTKEYEIPEKWKNREGDFVIVHGKIVQKEDKQKVRIFYLDDHFIIYDPDFSNIQIGSTIQISGQVHDIQAQRNPGCFDEETYYARKKYWTKIYADEISIEKEATNCIKEYIVQIREYCTDCMIRILGDQNGSILAAMVLGNKSCVDADEKELYQKAGLGHLMAVSGCHVSLLGGVLFVLFRRIRMNHICSTVLISLVLYFYILLCQMPISAVRAYLIYLILMGAKISGRPFQRRRTMIVVIAGLLVWNPVYLLDAGFLLSFGAMIGIWFVYPVLENMTPKYLHGFCVTVSIEIVLLPLLFYFYYEIPVYSLLFGPVLVGIFSLVMVCGCCGCLVWYAWIPVKWILNMYHEVCNVAVHLPYSRWVVGRPRRFLIVIYYCLLVCILYFLKRNKNIKYSVLFVAVVFIITYNPTKENVSFTMLDVGQGDCFVLNGPEGLTYMFDGGSSDHKQIGKYIIEPYLKYKGIDSIDYVFLSHGDLDHINGITEMLERQELGIRINNIVLPQKAVWDSMLLEIVKKAEEKRIRVLVMDEKSSIKENELTVRSLYPFSINLPEAGNDASLVLDIHYKNFSALMTGDLGKEGEERLMQNVSLEPYVVLKVGHHGSKNSSSEQWIQKVKPKMAFISSGMKNRYGHPHKEVVQLLEKYKVQICRTDQSGAIEIVTDGSRIKTLR